MKGNQNDGGFANDELRGLRQADARRRKLVQLRLLDRFDVCILQN